MRLAVDEVLGAAFAIAALVVAVQAMRELGRWSRAQKAALAGMSRADRRAHVRARTRAQAASVRVAGWAAFTMGAAYTTALFTVGQPKLVLAGPWALGTVVAAYFWLRAQAAAWDR